MQLQTIKELGEFLLVWFILLPGENSTFLFVMHSYSPVPVL